MYTVEKKKTGAVKEGVSGTTGDSMPDLRYEYNAVLEACIAYFNGDDLAATTWMNKYARKDGDGKFFERTPADMHRRMAREFARIERKYDQKAMPAKKRKELSNYGRERSFLDESAILELFDGFKYVVPQGSVMASLGNKQVLASLSNCIVLPEIYDSYGGIFYTDQQMAQLFKRRCGVGIDISTIRPAGMRVTNAARTTSGAVSFMERFSNTTREVAQNGRRGALMITMDIAHPDIEQFITVKQDLAKVTGANISVRISDEFMHAVETNSDFTLRFPVDSKKPQYRKTVKARPLWDSIVRCAHRTAEPGIIFWDRQHRYSTSSIYPGFKNVSTNPCSEIAMQGGDSCRLIALNLLSFVEDPFTSSARFDFKKFFKVTYESQRLMDDLVDLELEAIDRILAKVENDPEPEFIKSVELNTWKLLSKAGRQGRRTGLGFTALADALAALGYKFDSEEAIAETEKIMRTKCEAEFESSVDLALERGKFEVFDPAIESKSGFSQMMKKEFPKVHNRMLKFGRRNISLSTVAPTGTLSLLTRTSSGIEPVYMLSYKRRRKVNPHDKDARVDFTDKLGDAWQEFTVYHPGLKHWMEITGNSDESKSPFQGATAPEIDWEKRVKLQSVVQKYTTHSISSTINLPANVSVEQVSTIYLEAWRQGLKGITVYRDGSRSGVLVAADAKQEKKEAAVTETKPPRRPKALEASVVRFMNHNEKWIAVVGILNSRPYEVFTGKAEDTMFIPPWVEQGWVLKNTGEDGKKRYDFQYKDKDGYKVTIEGLSRSFNKEFWNYAKLISGVLRHGMPLQHVVNLVENMHFSSDSINSWKAGVERALKKFIPDGTFAADRKCSNCGDPDGLIYEEGCLKCKSCGHSKCG